RVEHRARARGRFRWPAARRDEPARRRARAAGLHGHAAARPAAAELALRRRQGRSLRQDRCLHVDPSRRVSDRAPAADAVAVAAPALERRLGPVDAAAIIVSNVIGSGIFLTPAFVAALTGDAWSMNGVWLLGGGIAFAGAMAYAELAALRPRAGGEYVYLREAFGPMAAFLTGWTSFVAGFSGAIAASAVGFASYIGRFVPAAGDVRPLVDLPLGFLRLTVTPQALVAILVIALLSLVHVRGLGPGRLVQNVLAGAKVTGLVLLILLGFGVGEGSWTHFGPPSAVPPGSWLLALVPVMFSYSGWNAASYVAEEIRNPPRFLPRALGLGTGAG